MQMLRNDLFQPWFVGESQWGFEIISGEFQGISVQIESVEFSDSPDGNLALDYHLVHRPEMFSEDVSKDPLFIHTIELIINDILTEAIAGLKNDEQNRNNDSEESSSQ
jgi:hypothetical protein